MQSRILTFLFLVFLSLSLVKAQTTAPLRVGVAGLTHGHVGWILGYKDKAVVEVVGIAEPDKELAQRYAKQYGFSMDIVFSTLEEMLTKTKPEAVTAFNSIVEHLDVVKACAPKGIHVMVEKPLSFSLDHARQMEALALKHHIHLLTNYETTWYGSNHKAYALVNDEHAIGDIRKVVVHDGHKGPKEINVGPEFLGWLTDPKKNGGGAIIDFGCYGADLITWLMKGEKPLSVTAITQQIKPEIYPKVDDEATIILTYPHAQGIIQASWNWPVSRKDMEVYGQTGYVNTIDALNMRTRIKENEPETQSKANATEAPLSDSFVYLAAVVKGNIKPISNDLSSLSINMTVVEILDAALRSAYEKKTIYLSK
ncbi:MAG TPA: Gfo/Idh/MocA family oxidoreductase [Cyclobacteriaceae bacterium]|jgi:predicted dehydrogenase|nr:Gfo/Idh/MocA family oxidoreductase [Cyclobacteriaceae bacterium]